MPDKKFSAREAATLKKAVALGLSIQHKFKPEPLYKTTGKGYMKSAGVAELARIKENAGGDKRVAR
jgi:hypothetical protein